MRRSEARWALLLLVAAASVSSVAVAAEVTDVATAFDTDNPFDFRFRIGYEFLYKSAAIKREYEGPGQDQVGIFKDLLYHQQRHTMSLRAEVGIYHDLSATIELPFVLSDSRDLSYDQRLGSECNYTGNDANCVNAANSTTTNSSTREIPDTSGLPPDTDPTHFIVPQGGYDALNMGAPFAAGSDMVFRGPKRGGSGGDLFDTMNFGLTWAALSQKRDPSKPTWTVGLEYRVSVGNVMKFDRSRPDANHAVSDGLDHVVARTAVSHRFKYVDPYVVFWFDYPFARRDDTLFINYGPQEKNSQPQMSGGTTFGLEGIPWEKNNGDYKIAIDVNGRISAKFDGRGYSEIWEALAGSPALACETNMTSVNYNPSCDPARLNSTTMQPNLNNYQGKPFTGLTVIENYATLGAEVALNVQAGKYVRFRANFLYQHDQSHFITTDDVGKPNTAGGRVSQPEEFNPAFRPIINEPGRRYLVDGVDIYTIGLWAQMMF
jgi:hypothetical protein